MAFVRIRGSEGEELGLTPRGPFGIPPLRPGGRQTL